MNNNKLIRMANQIGGFFQSMPNHDEALAGVVNHIRNTWEPRMRQNLREHIQTHGDSELSPLLKEALPRILAE
jgi:formate dehydrogenase subunit delta